MFRRRQIDVIRAAGVVHRAHASAVRQFNQNVWQRRFRAEALDQRCALVLTAPIAPSTSEPDHRPIEVA
jgi:hypothetical protein